MSNRNERWKKSERDHEYVSDLGVVQRDNSNTWVGIINEGFGTRTVGRGYTRARNAMIAVEEAAKSKKPQLPPIHFPANIFGDLNAIRH